jgi:hypothetical protein
MHANLHGISTAKSERMPAVLPQPAHEMALFIWLIIRLIQLVFSAETVFFSQKNQPTVFFSRLIIPAERLHYSQCVHPGTSYRTCSSSLQITENADRQQPSSTSTEIVLGGGDIFFIGGRHFFRPPPLSSGRPSSAGLKWARLGYSLMETVNVTAPAFVNTH